MLVFGDHERVCAPEALRDELCARLAALADVPAGLTRHAGGVGELIAAGQLAQGVADRAQPTRDGRDPLADRVMRAVVALARAVDASWRGGFAGSPHEAAARAQLAALTCGDDPITVRRPEGYAFYAVYPEAYLAAAEAAPPAAHVIGIRSIGTGLAALLATRPRAALPSTVRPHGDPFARHLAVDPALLAEWRASPRIAIADEGPGLSGSSFGAVLDALEAAGVAPARVACFPSHAGPLGPVASAAHRARWQRVARHVVDVDALLLRTGVLARWIAALVGPLEAPLEDLSGGAWRACFAWPAEPPAAIRGQERRKLRARTARGRWLARFVGLGRDGERALERARELHRAGFVPEVAGLCHGFLVERWIDGAPVTHAMASGPARHALIDHVARYLGFRARQFAVGPGHGASLRRLAEMTRRNTELALGAAVLPPGDPGALEARVRPIAIDGALHAHEWLALPGGGWIKTDAHDHHAAHDLVGCQDVAWDLAGATSELALSPSEQARLAAMVEGEAGRTIDRALWAFLTPCYLAFQLGRYRLAADSDPDEAPRLHRAAERYACQLAALRSRS